KAPAACPLRPARCATFLRGMAEQAHYRTCVGVSMEFDLIRRIAAHTNPRNDVVLGIGDDAALLRMPPNCELVACCDTLNVGVHFPQDALACDIGWKALAVNLSDLAAMGATPMWALLSLTLPEP